MNGRPETLGLLLLDDRRQEFSEAHASVTLPDGLAKSPPSSLQIGLEATSGVGRAEPTHPIQPEPALEAHPLALPQAGANARRAPRRASPKDSPREEARRPSTAP